MNKFVITTIDNKKKANSIAKNLISNKLAACVNILSNVEYVYQWKGEIHTDNEFIMIIKTKLANVDSVKRFIQINHNYDIPEIITSNFSIIDEKYLKWFNNSIEEIK